MDDPASKGQRLLERLRELPGGSELLELAAQRDDVELIGGATRDLLLGRAPRELDVVVAADARAFAGELAGRLGLTGQPDTAVAAGTVADERFGTAVHERFGTALVWWQAGRIDVAVRRSESYPAPGALPNVHAGTPQQDLQRRDFTVNAIGLMLGGPQRGELHTVEHALDDLAAGRMRVLHEGSFRDDPTRLLRLARYLARLGFEPQQRTAELAVEALAAGALTTVSGGRVGAELRLALAEPDPVAVLARLADLGVLASMHPRLAFDQRLAAAALKILPEDGRPDLLVLAALLLSMTPADEGSPEPEMFELLAALEFTAGDRDRAIDAALSAPVLLDEMEAVATPSQLREVVHGVPLEALALAAALAEGEPHGEGQSRGAAVAAIRQWLEELRHVRLMITGDDLLAAGVPAGPEIGRRLASALERRLDGELDDSREAQLRAALEAPA